MKLPLWRLLAGLAIPAALAAVLLLLAPVYLANFRLQRYLRDSLPGAGTEESLRRQFAGRARELGLPVDPAQVMVSHPGGQTRVEIKYKVSKDFGPYQVDMHFDPSASR